MSKARFFMRIFVFFLSLTTSLSSVYAQKKSSSKKSNWEQVGMACIYSKGLDGGPTSSGKRLDMDALTAAHLKLPMGTKVRVTNLDNGKSVVVKINDRGPFTKKYIIDLTSAAAKKIGLTYGKGITEVRLTKVSDD